MIRDATGRPPGHQPENRPLTETDDSPVTTAATRQGTASAVMLHGEPAPEGEPAGRKRERRLQVAYGHVYPPCPGRGMFAFTYGCPACEGTHFGRSAEPVASGPRRSRCGVVVWLIIGDGGRPGTDLVMRAFADGWRAGLEARAERGTAA